MRSVSIRVTGKVQGVWYRVAAKSAAEALNLTGFVSNVPDGSVYMEVSGSASGVTRFITWCMEGPELARVDNTIIAEIDPQPWTSFEIQR